VARFLIDLSAWARSGHPGARKRWEALLDSDQLLCHPVFAVELLHNAIDPADYRRLREDLEKGFAWAWPDRGTADIALEMQQKMATGGPTGQRVKTADLLIAALAAQRDVGVLHYNRDYDLIRDRGRTSLQSEWLAKRGSLESAHERAASARSAHARAFGQRMIQLRDGADLHVWPELIEWMDDQLRARGLEVPARP
jgi:predicted nucleic acid-binding protein